MPLTTLNRTEDYRVKQVSATSPRGGQPDQYANRILHKFSFVPNHDESPADSLYKCAKPKSGLRNEHRLRIEYKPDDSIWGRFYATDGQKELELDHGPVTIGQNQDPHSQLAVLVMKGLNSGYLTYTFRGLLIPDPSAVQRPQVAPAPGEARRPSIGYSATARRFCGEEDTPDTPDELEEPDKSADKPTATPALDSTKPKGSRTPEFNDTGCVLNVSAKVPAGNGNRRPASSPKLPPSIPSVSPSDNGPGVVIQSASPPAVPIVASTETTVMSSVPKSNVVAQVVRIAVSKIRPFAEQPRKHFKPKSLSELGESLVSEEQQEAVTVKSITGDPDHDYELVNGERRYRAAKLKGLEYLDCIVKPSSAIPNVVAQHRMSIVKNYGGEQLNNEDTVNALLFQRRNGATLEELGKMFGGKSVIWVRQHLSIENLITPLRNRMSEELPDEERLTLKLALWIAKAPQVRQQEIFDQVWAIRGPKLREAKAKALVSDYLQQRGIRAKSPHHRRELDRILPSITAGALAVSAIPKTTFPLYVRFHQPAEIEAMRTNIAESIKALQALDAAIAAAQGEVYKRELRRT